nr:hypothetical protein [Tanacetum cinerariifolium]
MRLFRIANMDLMFCEVGLDEKETFWGEGR